MQQNTSAQGSVDLLEVPKGSLGYSSYLSSPSFIAFAQTWPGRAFLFACFGGMAAIYSPPHGLVWTVAAAAIAFAGAYRYWALLVTTGGLALVHVAGGSGPPGDVAAALGIGGSPLSVLVTGMGLVLFFAVSFLAIRYMRRNQGTILARRTTECLIGAVLATALLASLPWLDGTGQVFLWGFALILGKYCWYLGYALLDQRTLSASPIQAQLGTFRPMWAMSNVPFGKGMGYLRKVEAKTSYDLAVVQIKGVKLMAWGLVLYGVQMLLTHIFHGILGIPSLGAIFATFSAGERPPLAQSWASLVLNYFEVILSLSAFGHACVAAARMAGFGMLRNTYRPLEATTLAEFWNRYYYYFKELLVEFFFIPTFLRCFKTRPKLRVAFATFMAAGVGNWLYHFISDLRYAAEFGWWKHIVGYQTYAFYCAVLAIGILVSQIRKRPEREGFVRGKLIPILSIAVFFCLLQIFNDTEHAWDRPLSDHLRLFLYLFGA